MVADLSIPLNLKGMLSAKELSGEVLCEGGEVATSETLNREREMIALVNRGIGTFEQLGNPQGFIASDRLRPEQKNALDFVLNSRDRAVAISGAAGTGKTATLRELRRGLMEAGRQVVALDPTMSAVAELEAVGLAEAITIERALQYPRAQPGLMGRVIVVDEAGMVSGRQMWELLRFAERTDARIVFTGDTRQIQSVEAGDALRILETESRMKTASLREVQRQTDRDYRAAIEELRRSPESGFRQLEEIGAVRELSWEDRPALVAEMWEQARTARAGRRPSVLVVCGTHHEIATITTAIRERRRQAGGLGEARQVIRDVPLGWTVAQKRDWRNFRPGQVLGFHRAVKGIDRGATGEVLRADSGGILVRLFNGQERRLTRKQAQAFDVFERQTIEVAPGDQLLFTGNCRGSAFQATNGEIVRVDGFDANGRIRLTDGRVMPHHYTHVAHGYAITAHRSQGKSVDEVIVSADGMNRELFYVAASRGRERVTVVTSDADALRESVRRTAARQSATELARKALRRVGRGVHRGFKAGCDLVRSARRPVARDPNEIARQVLPERRTYEHGISR